jgi:hypothetical protein
MLIKHKLSRLQRLEEINPVQPFTKTESPVYQRRFFSTVFVVPFDVLGIPIIHWNLYGVPKNFREFHSIVGFALSLPFGNPV